MKIKSTTLIASLSCFGMISFMTAQTVSAQRGPQPGFGRPNLQDRANPGVGMCKAPQPAPMPQAYGEVRVGFSSARDLNTKKVGVKVRTRCFYYKRSQPQFGQDVGFDTTFELLPSGNGSWTLKQVNLGSGGNVVTDYVNDGQGRYFHNNTGINVLYVRVSQTGDVMMENNVPGVPTTENEKTFWDPTHNILHDGIFVCRPTTVGHYELILDPTLF